MAFYLFLLFTVVPLLELWLLVMLGQWTHAWVPILPRARGCGPRRGVNPLARHPRLSAESRKISPAGRMPGDALIDGALF